MNHGALSTLPGANAREEIVNWTLDGTEIPTATENPDRTAGMLAHLDSGEAAVRIFTDDFDSIEFTAAF